MKENDKKTRGLMNRLNGLNQCLSELQTTEADLMKALGALPETSDTCDPVDLSFDLDRFLFLLANTVEAREIHTLGHIERVTHLGVSLGQRLGLVEKDKKALEMGCVLHDIGKIGLPAGLLNQNHSLNAGDLARMTTTLKSGITSAGPFKGSSAAPLTLSASIMKDSMEADIPMG